LQNEIGADQRDLRIALTVKITILRRRDCLDHLIEGSPKNSTSTVPIMPWGTFARDGPYHSLLFATVAERFARCVYTTVESRI
jgi:hypothetical protein